MVLQLIGFTSLEETIPMELNQPASIQSLKDENK